MKKALITLLDDAFVIGTVAFLKSLKKHNPWFDMPFVVLDLGLSPKPKATIESLYDNVRFVPVKKKNYKRVKFNRTAARLRNTYYTFDVFLRSEYDRVVFIDMDTVVLGDISELWDTKHDFAGCKAYNAGKDTLINTINSGVFSVSKKHLNRRMYERLIAMSARGHSMPDQTVLNNAFRREMQYFNKSYNVEKRMLHTKKYIHILEKMRILHFVGSKPWEDVKPNKQEARYGRMEKIWKKYYAL